MHFLTRFLKIFIFALVLSGLGALAFYYLIISGKQLRSDVSREEFVSTVKMAGAIWGGLITLISVLVAATGMKQTVFVPVYDKNTFLYRVSAAITSLRYRPAAQSENLLTFKPPGVAVFAEKISVQLEGNRAAITAPRGLLRKIQERL